MYRSCIFCSAALGSNESIERFPVGRSLAFDAGKGRLWAVCGTCTRWNLAPIEERWEAIEDAERLFRDTRLRVQSENVGLAKLPDGTRLIRVGQALRGELAAWRYGESLVRRRRGYQLAGGTVVVAGAGLAGGGIAGLGFSLMAGYYIFMFVHAGWKGRRNRRVLQRFRPRPAAEGGRPVTVRCWDMWGAQLLEPEGGGIGIHFPRLRETWEERIPFDGGSYVQMRSAPLVVTGEPARALLGRGMVFVNERGARADAVGAALRWIEAAGSPESILQHAAKTGHTLLTPEKKAPEPLRNLALEMALHEETERRALDGELAMLEAMWREAEEIAAIADRLPELPAPEPPRLASEG
jgi:hypothetical protein